MSLDVWIAFLGASALLLAVPGPTVMLVNSAAMTRGRASGWATVASVALGDLTAMVISLAGAGAVLADSALVLHDRWRMFRATYVVTALNPKSILFFVAFVLQFMHAAARCRPRARS